MHTNKAYIPFHQPIRTPAPVSETDVITTGFHLLAPFVLKEWLSIGMTPSEALELLLLADLEPAELDALFDPRTH